MDFYIKNGANLPLLKVLFINDGRPDFQSIISKLSIHGVFFSMYDLKSGVTKIQNSPAQLVEFTDTNGNTEYYIQYQFRTKDTNKSGKYRGEFTIKTNGVEILPIMEDLNIFVLDSISSVEQCCPVIITPTPSQTPTRTTTPTPTQTPTQTPTNTTSQTPTNTQTPSNTPTQTITPTVTRTNTPTVTITPTNTQTPSNTPTQTITPTVTRTNTPTVTITPTRTSTPTPTPSLTPLPILRMTFQSPNGDPTVAELPLVSTGDYSFTVNWGDSTSDTITDWNDGAKVHTYGNNSLYEVTIVVGSIKGFSYGNAGVSSENRANLRTITEWGDIVISGNTSVLSGCVNLTSFANGGPILVTSNSLTGFFQGCSSLTNLSPISDWDINNIYTNIDTLQDLFNGCTTADGTIDWDTSNITDMSSTFEGCTVFNGDISSWNTSGVTSMNSMFKNCDGFNQNISSWNVSSVTNMDEMFSGARTFNFNLENWEREDSSLSAVTSMRAMFSGATAFDSKFDGWNIYNVGSLQEFMNDKTYPSAQYDNILNYWAGIPLQSNVIADFGGIQYTGDGEAARQYIIDTYNWTINDGGKA